MYGLPSGIEPDAVHMIDTAVKYVQACTLWDKHFTSMGMTNRGAFIDPAGSSFRFGRRSCFARRLVGKASSRPPRRS